ncbi:MAG: hypothetical protein JXK07_15095 [Spirochaetes bacterium]|nr:hypothetical protein [Spirochaetota bacterium]MBN2770634.1 hypothetical protein [Spirochaetota bacterium]
MIKSIQSAKLIVIFVLIVLISTACDSEKSDNSNEYTMPVSFIQKGPFISGSSVTIQILDEDFNPTGKSYYIQTEDDFGKYSMKGKIDASVIEVIARGYYFNEVTGYLTNSELTLRSLVDLKTLEGGNVNILTTLTKERIIYLVKNDGKSFADAKKQSETELLAIFGIDEDDVNGFESMDMQKKSKKDAILIAISAILQNNSSVAELSQLISKINIDIKEDGILDDVSIQNTITKKSVDLNIEKARENIEAYYDELSVKLELPDFELYVDSDGDGEINKYETGWDFDPTKLVLKSSNFLNADIYGYKTVVFKDKIWLIGGRESSSWSAMNYDVWCSDDGENWSIAAESLDFLGRYGHTLVVFDDKMWVIGGWEYLDNTGDDGGERTENDVWYTEDGINWVCATQSASFSRRVAHTSVVFDNKMWVIGGVYNGRDEDYFIRATDVWYSEDGANWIEANDSPAIGISDSNLRISHSSIVFDDKIWIIGGGCLDEDKNTSFDTFSSSDGIDWMKTSSEECDSYELYDFACSGIEYTPSLVFNDNIYAFQNNKVFRSAGGEYWSSTPLSGLPFCESSSSMATDLQYEILTVFKFKDKVWITARLAQSNGDVEKGSYLFSMP